jgi:tubulin--tyrosine ligase-like protein 12
MGDAILTNKESPRYVMDELGSALRHSDDPNFQVAPFMFLPDGTLKSAIRCWVSHLLLPRLCLFICV